MNINSQTTKTSTSFRTERTCSREFSSSSGDVSDHNLYPPKDDHLVPTSPHENVERWINSWEPVFASSEEEFQQDDTQSCKSSIFSEDDLSLGAEAVLFPHQEKLVFRTLPSDDSYSTTSKDTDNADHSSPVRRTKSDPTGGAYGREAEERTRASAGVEAKVTIGEKRSRWRASPRFRSQSFESVCSDVSTPSSVSDLLNALDYDPEEVLTNLGFYEPDLRTRIPERFLQNQSVARGISVDMFRMSIDEEDPFDANTTHSGGSWSDPGSQTIPARFEQSQCKLYDSKDQQDGISVPEICEPEEVADESFDLMRHLRLQRAHHKVRPGHFLEPVTEELEVSSTGSGSVQTRIAKKQISDESDDLLSTLKSSSTGQTPESLLTITNIEALEDVAKPRIELAGKNTELQAALFTECEDNSRLPALDNNKNLFSSSEGPLAESKINLSPNLVSKCTLSPGVPYLNVQESFELEEIATDEGDISRESRDEVFNKDLRLEDQRVKCLSRNDSGDSSGFEEGTFTDATVTRVMPRVTIEGEIPSAGDLDDFGNINDTNRCQSGTNLSRRKTFYKQSQVSDEDAEDFLADKCGQKGHKDDGGEKQRRKFGANLELFFFGSTESNQTVRHCECEAAECSVHVHSDHLSPPVSTDICSKTGEGCASGGECCATENGVMDGEGSKEQQTHDRREHCLHEIDILQKSVDKYQAGLNVLESVSTAHEMYHTKKTLIRMAGEVSSIQSLRRMISVELIKVKNLLLERKKRLHEVEGDYNENDEPMNPGITQEMADLLREQSALQDELLRLANDVLAVKKQTKKTELQQELEAVRKQLEEERKKSREEIENEVRAALIDELTQTYSCQIEKLQLEIQSKDDVIQELKKKLDSVT